MDITGLDAALSTVSAYDIGSSTSPVTLQEDIGVAMLGKSLDMTQTLGAGMVQMMENSLEVISIFISEKKVADFVLRLLLCPQIVGIFVSLCDFKNFYENFRLTFPLHLAILILVKAS